ncbi:MAG: TIGR03000 domain-containing protein [Planctomycetes bacterium]|nr:TIGR03000 domain-containing protein [Planctomycetota bacterium]
MTKILGKNRLCQLALVAVVSVAMAQSDAMAWTYVSYGSMGSYGSYGSSGSYASYGSYGSYGGGLFARMRARRVARQAARASASYASYGCMGSYGGYVASYSCSGSYGGATYGTPVESSAAPTEAPAEPEPADAPADDSAAIEVTLPAGAKVFVNGVLTNSTGSSRSYVSKGLLQGRTYSYKLRVEFERDGQKVVEQKAVQMRSGDRVEMSFGNDSQEQIAATKEPVKTALNVTVPAEARVFLSGAETKQAGTQRSFITQQLAAGEQWGGYTVRVELEQDGKKLVQERTLTVEGGESYELAFDFSQQDVLQVAQLD